MTSAKPSPLTSPAAATEPPLSSPHRCRRGGSRWCRRGSRGRGWHRTPRLCRTRRNSRRQTDRAGSASADDEIAEAVAIDVPGPGDRGSRCDHRCIDAVEAEAVGAVEGRKVEAGSRTPRLCRTRRNSRRQRHPPGSAPGAPMMMSAKPSPLTSPAPATEEPLQSHASIAIEPEAVGAVEVGERGGRDHDRRRHHDRAEADHDVVEVEVPQVLEAEQQRPARGVSARDHPLGAARVEVVLEPVGIGVGGVEDLRPAPCARCRRPRRGAARSRRRHRRCSPDRRSRC